MENKKKEEDFNFPLLFSSNLNIIVNYDVSTNKINHNLLVFRYLINLFDDIIYVYRVLNFTVIR